MDTIKCDLPCEKESIRIHELTEDEREILGYRFDFAVYFLCHQHYNDQFSRYKGWYNNKCCDPCIRHKVKAKSNLREISLNFARKVKINTEHSVIPGKHLCHKCFLYLSDVIQEGERNMAVHRQDNEHNQG